jgi:hypothetical protein
MITCFEYENCRFDGCCFSCFRQEEILHGLSPPIEGILEKLYLNDPSIDYKTFFKNCSDNYDWHEEYNFHMNEVLSPTTSRG